MVKGLKPIYTARTEAAALKALAAFAATWEAGYPAIVRLWERAWAQFVPFLGFDAGIGILICTTNAIESPGHVLSPLGQGPTATSPTGRPRSSTCTWSWSASIPTGRGRQRWSNRWKAALTAFDITFDGRISTGRK